MPRRIEIDDEDDMPRPRRRNAKAAAVEPEQERGLLMRMLLHSPKDVVAGLLAAAAVSAILTNALFLQAGRHPSPMFGTITAIPAPAPMIANPLPRPRPPEASRLIEPLAPPETVKPAETRSAEPKHVEPKSDAMTNLVVKSTAPAAASSTQPVARPPVSIPQSSVGRRIAAVQRALTENGYGQLKATGTIGADTQDAIVRFERARKLPITGQMSDRLVKELAAMTGRPID